jgi:mannose-1-phosphate guanylyltransferase
MQRIPNEMHRWGVILAGGDGTRLRPLTRLVWGDDRPKQFCPLLGRRTLLAQTRLRIADCILPSRTVFALRRAHEPFYSRELEDVPPTQMVVQPSNRGTLTAILWSLLHVIQRDPHAAVAVFPSDHFYSNEEKLVEGVESAFDLTEINSRSVILLGATPTQPEVEYGWIEPGAAVASRFDHPLMPVKRFWEKPSYQDAKGLWAQGCLWNTFVMVGRASAFVEMIQRAVPNMYGAFEPILTLPNPEMEAEMMQSVYEKLPIADFSREVLSVSAEMLAVARLGDVGWSDLGDPRRLMATLLKGRIENSWLTSESCNRSDLLVGTS